MMSNDAQASSSAGSPYLFPFSEIQLATQDFAENMFLGKGGFGNVYKGKLTVEGKDLFVAVKRLKSASHQGEDEFNVEVDMLSRLSHENVISLIGYYKKGNEMIIMYELMSNGTLEEALCKGPTTLTWLQRLKIILGVAKGLEYVHGETSGNERIIHRDVKSENVLLDGNWAAKISDFGLSKVFPSDPNSTHVTTLVKYTPGYCDPCYWRTRHISLATDVYAFGVIVLQILCGRKALDNDVPEEQRMLDEWAKKSINKGRLKKIVDSNLKDTPSSKCLKMLADLAVRCLNDDNKSRPTMADAVKEVESILALQEEKMEKKPGIASIISSAISSKPFELNHLSVGGQDQIFRQFDYKTIRIDYDTIHRFAPKAKVTGNRFDTYKGNLKTGRDVVVCGPFIEDNLQEFMNEASRLANLKHANVVQLVGYSVDRKDVYLLYDVKQYETLQHLVFGIGHVQLGWDARYKILVGVASALVYLHNHAPVQVIHSAVKPGHIMLDDSLKPKLFGFYSAKTRPLGEIGTSDGRTEYVRDVCDYGMLLLETVTGISRFQQSVFLRKYVETKLREGKLLDVIDSRIVVDLSLLKFVIIIGLRCTQVDSKKRPTMEEVVDLLLCASSGLVRSINTLDCDVRVRTIKMGYFIGTNLMPSQLYLPIVGDEDQIITQFDFDTVLVAPGAHKLSETHFGTFKGNLENGHAVVVCGPFTEDNLKEYMNEASILANLKHENLVQLAGYDVKERSMYLFYDFNPYATLDHLLFGGIDHVQLDWDARYKILVGVAEVLVYLHNHAPVQVTHSAVKPGHIMLDDSLNPKLFGFYFAQTRQLGEIETSDGRTEFTKSDVHIFGVLLLETLTGIRRTDQSGESLVNLVETKLREGKLLDVIDRTIAVDSNLVKFVIIIGLRCTQVDPRKRPTMQEVVDLLLCVSSGLVRSIYTLDCEVRVRTIKIKPSQLYLPIVGGENQIFSRFNVSTVLVAPVANKFSETHFGTFKGNLQNRRHVVVSGPFNEDSLNEYMNEASMLANLKHENLVQLYGYDVKGGLMYLFYDCNAYATLHHLLFGMDSVQLGWDARYKILLGVALVLAYLHNYAPVQVIHSAVKPVHIMIDMSFKPKLFGFYSAKTRALGEIESGDGRSECTESDVRDFGVLLLETLTGIRRADQSGELLVNLVETKLREGKLLDVIDRRIVVDLSLLKFVIIIGLRCAQVNPRKRPTMQEVVDLLFCASLGLVRSINTLDCDVRVRTLVMGPFIGSNSMPLRLYLPIIGGEDQIFWRFDVSAVVFSHEANKFSQTQFGTCKGYLGNGRPVVVCGPFTEYNLNEYMNEASILANLKHENLVQLAGYDVKGGLMYLFYDCNPYATLDHLLFGGIDCIQLDWDARYKIIVGVAEVLVYLHNHAPVQVTHSAVKPGHIILDMSLNPKLFGFYYAQTRALGEIEMSNGRTKCTESDVHDFGVLLLETLTGIRRTQSGELLENFVERSWREGKLGDIIDRRISVELSFLERVIMIGLMCTRVDRPDMMFNRMAHRVEPRVRPTMKEVVGLLRGTLSGDFKQSMDKLNWEMGVMKKKMGG